MVFRELPRQWTHQGVGGQRAQAGWKLHTPALPPPNTLRRFCSIVHLHPL